MLSIYDYETRVSMNIDVHKARFNDSNHDAFYSATPCCI